MSLPQAQSRRLGSHFTKPLAFGTMSLPDRDEAKAMQTLDSAWAAGITHFDTANIYGMGVAETYLGKWLKSRNPAAIVATKASIIPGPPRQINNEPAYLRAELEGSLRRLGRDHVDLFYMHRRNEDTPLHDLIGLMQDLITEGKISGYGLSEVSPSTLRLAHAIHPCVAVQNEYSLWTRQPEMGLLQTCAELDVAFVAFSPLGRGIFGDQPMEPPKDAFRTSNPRFMGENLSHNLAYAAQFRAFCQDRGWTSSATALAWVMGQAPQIIALPGTSKVEHLQAWLAAETLPMTPDDLAQIAKILPLGFAHGARYGQAQRIGVQDYC